MRQPCLQCFMKHMGNAQVLIEECLDGYPYLMGVIGHLDQAAQEIRGFSRQLATLVRAHRIRLQQEGVRNYSIPFEAFEIYVYVLEEIKDLSNEANVPEIPEECYAGLEKDSGGNWVLYEGDQR